MEYNIHTCILKHSIQATYLNFILVIHGGHKEWQNWYRGQTLRNKKLHYLRQNIQM